MLKSFLARFGVLASLGSDEQGATAIEYGLIAALVAIVLITVLTTMGSSLSTTFTSISNAL